VFARKICTALQNPLAHDGILGSRVMVFLAEVALFPLPFLVVVGSFEAFPFDVTASSFI